MNIKDKVGAVKSKPTSSSVPAMRYYLFVPPLAIHKKDIHYYPAALHLTIFFQL